MPTISTFPFGAFASNPVSTPDQQDLIDQLHLLWELAHAHREADAAIP